VRIAQLAPLAESVPPKGYGGTELVVSMLSDELVKRGHRVTLFATGDSITSAELVSIIPYGMRIDNVPQHRWCAYETRAILELTRRQDEFDIIHNHCGFLAWPFLNNMKTPCVSTNHNPVVEYCADIYLSFPHLPVVAISDAYKRLNYPARLNYVGRVYNAVEDGAFPREPITPDRIGDQKGRDYLLFLGRVSHAKGTADAIKIARAAKLPLKIAGKIDSNDQAYFDEHIRDELHSGVEYIGEVGFEQKVELYKNAKAVVYPIHFEEPFGLVMTESLAAGTPLIALNRGSVSEVLIDKVNAVVGKTVEELIDRVPEVDDLKSSDCIAQARTFSVERMTSAYEDIYRRIIETAARDQKKTHVLSSR
jgi:glycosyltransferase involved in cell wall biosynthesis